MIAYFTLAALSQVMTFLWYRRYNLGSRSLLMPSLNFWGETTQSLLLIRGVELHRFSYFVDILIWTLRLTHSRVARRFLGFNKCISTVYNSGGEQPASGPYM